MFPHFSLVLINHIQPSGNHYYVDTLRIVFNCYQITLIDYEAHYNLYNNDIIHFRNLTFRVCLTEQVAELSKYTNSIMPLMDYSDGIPLQH